VPKDASIPSIGHHSITGQLWNSAHLESPVSVLRPGVTNNLVVMRRNRFPHHRPFNCGALFVFFGSVMRGFLSPFFYVTPYWAASPANRPSAAR